MVGYARGRISDSQNRGNVLTGYGGAENRFLMEVRIEGAGSQRFRRVRASNDCKAQSGMAHLEAPNGSGHTGIRLGLFETFLARRKLAFTRGLLLTSN